MRIAIIAPADLPLPAVFGGAVETLITNFIEQNEELGLHELLAIATYNSKAYQESLNFQYCRFTWLHKGFFYKVISGLFKILRKFKILYFTYDVLLVYCKVKKFSPDIVLVEGNPIFVRYIKQKMSNSCRVIFHIHALLIEGKHGNLKDALTYSDKIIVVSNFVKNELIFEQRVESSKVEVVYNCAGNSFFKQRKTLQSESLRQKFNITNKDFVLLFVGRIVPEKGILELLKACKRVKETIPFKLLVAGSFGSNFGMQLSGINSFRELLMNEISNLEDNVVFTGYVSNSEINELYRLAHVSVIPSLCNDAAPLVALEAMAVGLPIIYSNKGGIKEYVTDECGIMVDMDSKRNVELLVNAIRTLYINTSFRNRCSLASFRRAQEFTQSRYYEKLTDSLKTKALY